MTVHIEMAKHRVEARCSSCAGGAPRPAKIAIIGGGFSGTLVLANLVASAEPGTIEIKIFEARGKCGPGTAYATLEGAHILNVQADRMGATSPEDFHRWLQTVRGRDVARQFWPEGRIEATDYVPRALYGRYLEDLLADVLDNARRQRIRVHMVRDVVTDVFLRKEAVPLAIVTKRTQYEADAMVLATGNIPPRPLAALSRMARRSPRYIDNPWHADIAHHVGGLSDKSEVLIIGTGLTAVDGILSLRAQGFAGKIVAVSRHGRLPLAQRPGARIPWTLTMPPDDVAPKARALVAWLRREARLAEAEGVGWRSVLDSVRPATQKLWRALDNSERLKLFRRLWLWNIHRHRMAPKAHAAIEELRESGQLEIHAARCMSVKKRWGGFVVQLRHKGAVADETIRPALILNCSGPHYDLAERDDPLLKNLLCRGLVFRSSLGAIAIGDGGIAEGRNGGRIFAVGPSLAGELLETTAVPELREFSKHVAGLVHARLSRHFASFR